MLGAGELDLHVLRQALEFAPVLVAADGGVAPALAAGFQPRAVIGDMDSAPAEALAGLPPGTVHRLDDQETTDFDKCLRSIRAPLVIAVGFTGARLDHELAAFSTLARHVGPPCILLGPEDAAFVAPSELSLDLPLGTRVSLFPLGAVRGESRGLRWPIDGIDFAPDRRIGTSNETVAERVALRFDATRMLVILPRSELGAAVRALAPELAATGGVRAR